MVRSANLRGRAAAPISRPGVKWGFLPATGNPRFLCANADESEPGTFANRAIMDNDPHQLIEGCLLSAYACQINTVYIYIPRRVLVQLSPAGASIGRGPRAGLRRPEHPRLGV